VGRPSRNGELLSPLLLLFSLPLYSYSLRLLESALSNQGPLWYAPGGVDEDSNSGHIYVLDAATFSFRAALPITLGGDVLTVLAGGVAFLE
jgi:hypothetical protein